MARPGKRLTAFDIRIDGSLANRRVWADLGDGFPDGICLDADGAIWYGDVPNKRCVRVAEGGEVLQRVNLDRGCVVCMLGGRESKTAAEWRGFEHMDGPRTGQVLAARRPRRALAGQAGDRSAHTKTFCGKGRPHDTKHRGRLPCGDCRRTE